MATIVKADRQIPQTELIREEVFHRLTLREKSRTKGDGRFCGVRGRL